jgi:hypothetical protein
MREIAGSRKTGNVNASVPTQSNASATDTVITATPVLVGVPVISPPVDRLSPAGNAPPLTANTYGSMPPEATSVVA